MKLHLLPKSSNQRAKRVGRGESSGLGKTSGRGNTGAKSRSGYRASPVTSGIPWYRKLPMRGFSNFRFRRCVEEVRLDRIADLRLDEINPEILLEKGLAANKKARIKIIGRSESLHLMRVHAHFFSQGARDSIEAAGGTVIEID